MSIGYSRTRVGGRKCKESLGLLGVTAGANCSTAVSMYVHAAGAQKRM